MALTPGLQLPYGIQPVKAVPVDAYLGPFSGSAGNDNTVGAVAAANAAIGQAFRYQSMEVHLIITGSAYKFWYKDGIADNNLVEFAGGSGGGSGPAGAQGPQGYQGAQGPQGDQGPQGASGGTGVQGDTGVQGATGAQGPQGYQGPQGPQGDQGSQGPQGYQGFQGTQGYQGFQGDTGAQGPQGYQGAAGAGTPGGSDTQVQFNDANSFAGNSNFVFNKTSKTLTVTNLSGSLTTLSDGTPYLIAGSNVTITSGSNGSVTIASTGGGGGSGLTQQQVLGIMALGGY